MRIRISIPGQRADHGAGPTALWRLVANALAALHVGYVAFVVSGALLVSAWPPLIWVHLAAVAWAGATMIFNFGCPVTDWEKSALRRAGRDSYEEGFLQHHVLRRRFGPATVRRNHALLGISVILLNLVLYSTFLPQLR